MCDLLSDVLVWRTDNNSEMFVGEEMYLFVTYASVTEPQNLISSKYTADF